jgi:S1-C subfamily serine protease
LFLGSTILIAATATAQTWPESPQGSDPTAPNWEQTVQTSNANSIVFISIRRTLKNGLTEISSGTGFIVDSNGYVITCNHVVPQQSDEEPRVLMGAVGGRYEHEYPLEVIDVEERHDLILLKLPGRSSPWHSVQAMTQAKAGTHIVALGFFEDDLLGVPGSITNTGGKGGRWMTNSGLNRGMSGGPVFEQSGAIVAIVRGGREDAQLVNELIPISFSTRLLQLIGSPLLSRRNQAMQRSAEELLKANADLEKSRAMLAEKQLPPKQNEKIEQLFEKGEKTKEQWVTLYTKYLDLNRNKPGPKSASDRQEIVTEMQNAVTQLDAVSTQLVQFTKK